MNEELPTILWIQAGVRACHTLGTPVYVARKGDEDRGMALVKIVQTPDACTVWGRERNRDMALVWTALFVGPEPDADAFIARAVARDTDLWVVEVMDKNGKNPFDSAC